MEPNKSISEADMAFGPNNISTFLPAMGMIPEEFKKDENHYSQFISKWLFSGLSKSPEAVEGVDINQALRHIKVVLSSWEPKHEHKIAGAAYLASLWLTEDSTK